MNASSDTLKTQNVKPKDRRARILISRRTGVNSTEVAESSRSVTASSILSSRGQVVIPREVRDVLKAKKGDRVVFQMLDDHTMLVRIVKKPTSDDLFGVLQSTIAPGMRNREWDEIRQIAREQKAIEYSTGESKE